MSLVDTETGEVVADLTPEEARDLTEKLRTALSVSWELVKEAFRRRAWAALGYESWDDYCVHEFDDLRLRLPREERREVVVSLREAGMSTRAIASATGVSKSTVSDVLNAGVRNRTPAPESSVPRVDPADYRDSTGSAEARAAYMASQVNKSSAPEGSPPSSVEPDGGPGGHAADPAPTQDTEDTVTDTITGTDGKTYPVRKKPKPGPAADTKRIAEYQRLADEGMSTAEIAEATGCTYPAAHQFIRAHGIVVTAGRTGAASAARSAKVRQMAAEGHTTRQIATAVNLSESGVKYICDRDGIDVPADVVASRTRRLDSNRIVEQTVIGLEGETQGLDLIDFDDLDPDRIADWVTSLTNSLRLLNRFSKQLKEMTQ